MFDWLFRNRKNELPLYSLLDKVPSRGIPQALAEMEKSDEFSRSSDRIQTELSGVATDHNAPGFATFLKAGDCFFQTLQPNGDTCLVVFSTPIRAADFARVELRGQKLEYFCSSPGQAQQFIQTFREGANVRQIAIDLCPRCPTYTALETASIESTEKLIVFFNISKTGIIARCGLYREYARTAANGGQLLTARDVALELVGHVTAEDPLTHLLLGKLAIRLRDRTLLREAHSYLAFLRDIAKLGDVSEQLRAAETTTDWQF